MKHIIKNIQGEIIAEGEAQSFKEFVEQNKANLKGADLQGADLWRADLWEVKINPDQKDDLLKSLGIIF